MTVGTGRMRNEDWSLSRAISRPARNPQDNEGLRTLLVGRVVEGPKGVWRRTLKDEDRGNFYCEPCDRWSRQDAVKEFLTCGRCGRVYRVETSILEEVVDDTDDTEDSDSGGDEPS